MEPKAQTGTRKRIPYTYPYTEEELYECRDPILVGERGDFDPFEGMSPRTRAAAKIKRDAEIAEIVKQLEEMSSDSSDDSDENRRRTKRKRKEQERRKRKK